MGWGQITVRIGDRVMIDDDKKGQIKWIGVQKLFGPGVWYGVRLVEARGNCDGTYKGIEAFKCPHNCGLYVQKSRITKLLPFEKFDFMQVNEKVGFGCSIFYFSFF